jgi:PPOX class probable F420-dependent enzyme
MARPMSEAEIQAFLTAGTRTGKLATTMADGSPHVMPIWFLYEDGEIILNTATDSVKARNLQRDPRASLVVDEEVAPYSFVHVRGSVTLGEDPAELLRTATAIGARYMGAERGEEFGRRNAVPGELIVRLRPTRVIALADLAD